VAEVVSREVLDTVWSMAINTPTRLFAASDLVLAPDPRLRTTLVEALAAGQRHARLGGVMASSLPNLFAVGLAANQIASAERLFVAALAPRGRAMTFINPRLLDHSDKEEVGIEGCLSIPALRCVLRRPDWVELAWTDLNGERQSGHFEGFAARVVSHELDHLNGVLMTDRALELLEDPR